MSKSKKTTPAKAVAEKPALPALANFSGKMSRTGWQLPNKLELDQWTKCGRALSQMEGAMQWWLGDWWAYGEHAYGERKALFEEGGPLEGLNFGTLANYGRIARAIETSHRCEVLSFKHHEYVASLSAAQQRKWLERAVKEGWTSRQLKSAIDAELPAPAASDEVEHAEPPRLNGGQPAALADEDLTVSADETVPPSGGIDVPQIAEATAQDKIAPEIFAQAFADGMAWFDDDIFNLPAGIFCGRVSSSHLRKVADLLIRIADEQSKDINPTAREEPTSSRKTSAKDAAERERLDWEASHPKEAKAEALKQAQDKAIKAMPERDLEWLKVEAEDDDPGVPWREIKDEKFAEWLIDHWEGDAEADFEREFNEEWLGKHGTPHPDDVEGNLFISIKNTDGPYEIPDDEDDVLIHAAWNLEAAGHIMLDHDSGPKILASYIQHGEADRAHGTTDEDLFNSIKNADELYEVPDGSLEVALRLEQAGRIKLAYSGSKTYANVIDGDLSIPTFMDRTRDHTDKKKLH